MSAPIDWSAWVSAGAAVVQAVGAVVAIWYSGKLARDSASREIAAEAANVRRINDANAAAAEQRRLDHAAAERAINQAEVRAFNEPIALAIGLADHALPQIILERDRVEVKAKGGDKSLFTFSEQPGQQLLLERMPDLIARAKDAESGAALRTLMEKFQPYPGHVFQNAEDWLPMINGKVGYMRAAVEALLEHIIHTAD